MSTNTTSISTSYKCVLVGASIGISLFAVSGLTRYLRKVMYNKKLKRTNAISLVHKFRKGETVLDLDHLENINIMTHLKFLKEYDTMDKDKDIHIAIQTVGGSMTCTEAICNAILYHKGKGKIKCYIPNYAYSGGLMVALCCDEIIMSQNAIVSPCDGQVVAKDDVMYSSSSIIDAVSYKREKKEPIKEEWLASDYEAKKCVDRQKTFVNKICKEKMYDDETQRILYEELFSGKHNHDHSFSANEFTNLGTMLKITVVGNSDFPTFITEMVEIK